MVRAWHWFLLFFFFQAEDGIRDDLVTGVQTCALPICQSAQRHGAAAKRAGCAGSDCPWLARHRQRASRCRDLEMELTLIDFYRAIEDSSAKMLQAAQNKDWEEIGRAHV